MQNQADLRVVQVGHQNERISISAVLTLNPAIVTSAFTGVKTEPDDLRACEYRGTDVVSPPSTGKMCPSGQGHERYPFNHPLHYWIGPLFRNECDN